MNANEIFLWEAISSFSGIFQVLLYYYDDISIYTNIIYSYIYIYAYIMISYWHGTKQMLTMANEVLAS